MFGIPREHSCKSKLRPIEMATRMSEYFELTHVFLTAMAGIPLPGFDTVITREDRRKLSFASRRMELCNVIDCSDSCGRCDILRCPEHVLIQIILFVNARDRVALGNTCCELNRLVFGEKKLLRNLDFSIDGHLTSALDIYCYFSEQSSAELIYKVNLSNCVCLEPSRVLKDYVKNAINLVDLNIQGIKFQDIMELANFLCPLLNVQRLSINWPYISLTHFNMLYPSFCRLKYLSILACEANYTIDIITCLGLCKGLKELHIFQVSVPLDENANFLETLQFPRLENLGIVEYCGHNSIVFLKVIKLMLMDHGQWMHFAMTFVDFTGGFYLGIRSVFKTISAIGQQRREVVTLFSEKVCAVHAAPIDSDMLIQPMNTHVFVDQLIGHHYENVPDLFCCLTRCEEYYEDQPFMMRVNEMKSTYVNWGASRCMHLIQQPVSYLNIHHSIEPECDVHLVVGVFEHITELVLHNIIKSRLTSSRKLCPLRRLKGFWETNEEAGELRNTNFDSCFKMLVGNTPNLREFRLEAKPDILDYDEIWDLDSLHLIAGWQHLRALCLSSIPIKDGRFLIEIGISCTHLEKLELYNMSAQNSCCYTIALLQMLMHLQNLTEFTFHEKNVTKVSEVFQCLKRNPELRKVSVKSEEPPSDTLPEMMSSMEHLLYRCRKLAIFFCVFNGVHQVYRDELTYTLQRSKILFNRPNLQFQVVAGKDSKNIIYEDFSPLEFPRKLY